MKKIIGITESGLLTVNDLPLNVLGDINRNRPGDADGSITNGTPATEKKVNQAVLEKMGLLEHEGTYSFDKMTYGPAVGFFCALDCLQRIPGLHDFLPDHITIPKTATTPEFCIPNRTILHGGNQTAESLVERANHSVLHQKQHTIFSLDDTHADQSSTRLTMSLETIQSLSAESKEKLQRFLMNDNSLVVILDSLVPIAVEGIKSPPLSVEIFGNQAVFEQVKKGIGFVGQILEPMSQWLFTLRVKKGVEETSIPTPDIQEITSSFLNYFGSEIGSHIEHGQLVSGGCSGALFNTLQGLPHKNTLIPIPFFAPQGGIAQSALHRLELTEMPMSEIPTLMTRKGGNLLLTFPNNPDGKIPSFEDMQAIVEKAIQHNWTLVIDATYFNTVKETAKENFNAIMQLITKSDGLSYLMIASGSKALAITKARVALVAGNPATLAQVQHTLEPVDGVSALFAEEALKPENRYPFKAFLMNIVEENIQAIQDILSGRTSDVRSLNSGLQKFNEIIATLAEKYPDEHITLDAGDGALYAKLIVPEPIQAEFLSLANAKKLALMPGEVFDGKPYTDEQLKDVLSTPQKWYRLAFVIPAYVH